MSNNLSEFAQTEPPDDSIFGGHKFKDEVEEEEHVLDQNKFTPMMYEETDYLTINNTKIVKNGSMDDVYIFEKVYVEEIKPILMI